jgi:hypothetical protein
MGTSNSYGGPGDTTHLIPDWARPGSSDSHGDTDNQHNAEIEKPQDQTPHTQPRELTWRTAKTALSRYASGKSGRAGLIRAGKAYVGAKGGAQKAAKSVVSGKSTGRNLGGFLSATAQGGIVQGLRSIGLNYLIGKDVDTVFAGIVNAITDNGEDFDKNIARQALEDALLTFYERCSEDQNFDSLEHLAPDQIKEAIEEFVSSYIYRRWLQELGKCIERKTVSEDEAIRLEIEVKTYVRDLVELKLDEQNPLSIDWSGEEGQKIIDSLFEEAYSLIEEGKE